MNAIARGERVLVRVPDWLGDLVMAVPALEALHELVSARAGTLTLIGSTRLMQVLGDALPLAQRRDAREHRAWRGHTLAVLFTNSFRSAWQARRARIPRVVGWSRDLRGWLLDEALVPAREWGGVPFTLGLHGRAPRYLPRPFGASCVELVQHLGANVRVTRPRLRATAHARQRADERLAALGLTQSQRFLLVNAGGRPGSAKAYPSASWARALASRVEPVIAVCGPGEEDALRELSSLRPLVHACVEPLVDLAELVALCERAALVWTADTGPRHVAQAVGARVVVVCGPTDPRHTADGTHTTTVLRERVACGPCHRERCRLVGAEHLRCMHAVEPRRWEGVR